MPPASPYKQRAADVAYDAIEVLIATLRLPPGSPVVEAELLQLTQLGRTPVREALLRMVSVGLIDQQPRRGLLVSQIDLAQHLDLIQTRRVLECLIAACAARRATDAQRAEILLRGQAMVDAAAGGQLEDYMVADHALDVISHQASHNPCAVKCVQPLIVKCRRFWYAYQHEGAVQEGARYHLVLAQAMASGDEQAAIQAAEQLMDYLVQFARKVIQN
jgi:DNA-binding GntR family transcriptional regulator